MNSYEQQAMNTCIQTHINLYGVMPSTQELTEMLGKDYETVIRMRKMDQVVRPLNRL